MNWDDLIAKKNWKCGHPRTDENTFKNTSRGYTYGRCRICKKAATIAYTKLKNGLSRPEQLK